MTPSMPQHRWYVSALPSLLNKPDVEELDGRAGAYAEGALRAFADAAHTGKSACRLAAPNNKAGDVIKQSMPLLVCCSQGQLSLLGWLPCRRAQSAMYAQIRWTGFTARFCYCRRHHVNHARLGRRAILVSAGIGLVFNWKYRHLSHQQRAGKQECCEHRK